MDRRVARTRALLRRAHLSLILEKGYETTTVEDICRAANVGRSTFYAHYASKEDLKRDGLAQLRKELLEHHARGPAAPNDSGRPALGFSLAMFEHARDHIDLYRALAGGAAGTMALTTIRQILSDLLRLELADRAAGDADDPVPPEVVVEFVVGAYMAVMTWWLDRGARLSPERMDAMFRRLVTEGVAVLAPAEARRGNVNQG
jgi:AcrR family transcriptional regulator